jgi:hypothetical protein
MCAKRQSHALHVCSGSKAYGEDVLFHIEKEPAIEAPVSSDDQRLMNVIHASYLSLFL